MAAQLGRIAVAVDVIVKVTPPRRTARFSVPLSDSPRDVLKANVNARDVFIADRSGNGFYLDKTLACADALVALADSIRGELIEQGVTD